MEKNEDVSSGSESEEMKEEEKTDAPKKESGGEVRKGSPQVSAHKDEGEEKTDTKSKSPHPEDKSVNLEEKTKTTAIETPVKEKSPTPPQKEASPATELPSVKRERSLTPVKEKAPTPPQEEATPAKELPQVTRERSPTPVKEKAPIPPQEVAAPAKEMPQVTRERSLTPVPQEMITVAKSSIRESYSTERGGGESEVVTESAPPVKEQIAMFSNLRIQETHGTPKPGVASAFLPKPVLEKPQLVAQQVEPMKANTTIFQNSTPIPFHSAEPTPKPVDIEPQPIKPTPVQKPVYTTKIPVVLQTAPKKEPELKYQQKPQVTLSTATNFGISYNSPQTTAQKTGRTGPYLGSDIVSLTTGPSMSIQMRRPSPETPWGFTIFGGLDYGCPPFINRLTLNTIASDAGLEVGDVIVSICNVPVQGKEHSQIKAEILRAGNELDFIVVKQGIDKTLLAERAPQLMKLNLGPQKESGNVGVSDSSRGSGSQVYRPIRTKSLKLLDEQLNRMSSNAPRRSNPQPQYADIYPTKNYHTYSSSNSYQTKTVVNRTAPGQYYAQKQPYTQTVYVQPSYTEPPSMDNVVPEMHQTRICYATPARSTQSIYLNRGLGQPIVPTTHPRVQSQPRPSYRPARQQSPTTNYCVGGSGVTIWGGGNLQQQQQQPVPLSTQYAPQTLYSGNWDPPVPNPTYYEVPTYQEPERWSTVGTVHTSTSGWM